jgi:hypothetical protein
MMKKKKMIFFLFFFFFSFFFRYALRDECSFVAVPLVEREIVREMRFAKCPEKKRVLCVERCGAESTIRPATSHPQSPITTNPPIQPIHTL